MFSRMRKSSSHALIPVRSYSSSVSKRMIITKQKIYFTSEEMEVIPLEKSQRVYVKSVVK